MNTPITHQDVEAFLNEELSKIQAKLGLYASIKCESSRHLTGDSGFQIAWGMYADGHGYSPASEETFGELLARIEKIARDRDPKIQAARLREQAADFLKRADELAATPTKTAVAGPWSSAMNPL